MHVSGTDLKQVNAVMRELLEEVIGEAKRRGASFADIRAGLGHNTSVLAEDGRIHKLSSGRYRSASVRVLVDGAWGFATTSSLDAGTLRQALDDAIAMARAAAPSVSEPARVAESEPVEAISQLPARVPPASVPLSERVSKIAALEERARKHSDKIVHTRVRYSDSQSTIELANSFGTYVRWERTHTWAGVLVVAANEETRQQAYESLALPAGWEVVADLDPDVFAGATAQRAVELLEAVEPPAGTMPVILDPDMTGLITHEAFGHNCEADLVWAGESIVAGKVGQQVAAESVTIVDDPTLRIHNGTVEYDDEGTPTQRHVLVENGILRGFLHSLETAAHFGVEPNGAARAAGISAVPIPRMSNTFIEPGDAAVDDLVSEVKRGVLIERSLGGYVMTTQGRFSFRGETGYEIENGRLGRRIRNCNLTGATLETLLGVRGVSKDFELRDSGTCGKRGQGVPVSTGGPYLLIEQLTVGGSRAE